ncbi:MAG: radical SAM protein [Elusimicrobia bacterium]|nr:radical SAM protein [Elusimicrobiota bacterium]
MNPFLKSNLRFALTGMPGLDAAGFKKRIQSVKWPINLKPRVCEVTVNSACNSRCLFCYGDPASFDSGVEPKLEEIFRALYAGRKQGCWIAAIIGGEPTLRPDIDKIAGFARKIGYPCIKLCSNGGRLSDLKYARRMAESGFNMFDIALHGHNALIHDKLLGVSGSFDNAMNAIKNMKRLRLEVGTNQVINALNYGHFRRFFEFAWQELGINYYNIIYLHYRGCVVHNIEALKIKISATAPFIKKGLEVLRNSGMPALSRILVNFPPCLFPEYLNILADWESEAEAGDPLMSPDGSIINMAVMKNKQSIKAMACARCILDKRCRGLDREYMSLFGDLELKPLVKTPESFAVKTIFKEKKGDRLLFKGD